MYNDNNRKLRTVLLVLAIVLVLLRLVKTANASEIPDDAFSDVVSFYDSHFSSSYKDYFLSTLEQCPYFVHFHYYTRYNERYFIILYSHEDMGYNFISNTGSVNGAGNSVFRDVNGVRQYSTAFTRNSDFVLGASGRIVMFYSMRTNMTPYISNVNVSSFASDWLVRPDSSYALVTSQSSVAGDNFNIDRSTFNDIVSFGNVYIQTDINSYVYHVTDYTAYTEDSRLKFWKFNNLDGSETLVTDLSDFLQGSEGVMNNEISGLTLTYELDNVEHTLTLDSSNSVVRRSGTATTYRVETPFSAFGFDSSVTTFDITKCDFTLTYSAYGYTTSENYKISCNYPAFRQSSPVEPAVIPSPAVSDPAVDSSVYTFIDTVYGTYSSDRYGRSGTWDVSLNEPSDVSVFRSVDVYHFANQEHGSGVDESIYYYSLLDWSNTQLDITAYTVFDWDKFLSENTSALYFDVISVPIYHFTPVGQSSTISGRVFDGYALFYTPSYFLRQQYGLLGDILTVVDQDSQNQYNNGIWLVDKINDFENKTLDVLNASLDIETDSLSWLKTIDNSIKSLDFPVFDDSSILSGLASIVTALSGNGSNELGVNGRLDKLINFFIANDAQKNESALAYRNWLDGLDPTETRRVTHFGTNIYSLVKNIFDIFDADYTEDPSFENPDKDYLDIASDYIDALNDRNNTNKFFRGFFDSSFDPLEQSGLPEE